MRESERIINVRESHVLVAFHMSPDRDWGSNPRLRYTPLTENRTLDPLTTESHQLMQVFFSLDEFMAMGGPSVPLKNILLMGDGSSCRKNSRISSRFS